jgi:hypothetical protein
MMTIFSQRDPRWAAREIGLSKLTVGRFGCTLTSVAMLSTYFGENLDPGSILSLLKFTPGGLLIWKSADFAKFRFERRVYYRDNASISAALKDLNRAVILEVAQKSHWVVATGWQPETYCFKIADPWLGDHSNMKRYGDNITGMAFFTKK